MNIKLSEGKEDFIFLILQINIFIFRNQKFRQLPRVTEPLHYQVCLLLLVLLLLFKVEIAFLLYLLFVKKINKKYFRNI